MKTSEKTVKADPRDLADSRDDINHMQPEETTIDLPDVKDIPSQEHIHPMPVDEIVDPTISSADEEVKGNLEIDDEEYELDNESNVTTEEKNLLSQSILSMTTKDNQQLKKATLDNVDDEGESLNEKIDQSGF